METVQAAVQKELNEPGKILGYRAINVRMQHEVQVQRNLVHKMLQDEDPEGLQFCRPTSKNKEKKRLFSCDGPLDVVSLDGQEKLCGYQIGLSHWVYMNASTLIRERSYSCTSTTRIQILCLLGENI